MKRNWKYGKQLAIGNWQLAISKVNFSICLLLIVYCLLPISACNNSEEHKQIPINKTSDLDGLAQPTNQTIFSSIKTISPVQKSITPLLNATGMISYDPLLLNNISSRFSGRIEKLYLRFNFENIVKGQHIMDIYSPEILTAQQDLIFQLKNPSADETLITLSKQKLQLLGFTAKQLIQLETTRKPINPLPVYSPYSGHIHDIGISNGVTSSTNNTMGSDMNNSANTTSMVQIENLPSSQTAALSIKEGMYLQNGQTIFAVYSTSRVWAVLNISPQDAALVKIGDKVFITAETDPENAISSTISYIEPVIGQNASAIKARVYLQNTDLHLKIGTLVSSKIISTEIKGLWLPKNAVVNLGQKQVVFLKTENHFISKIVQTGMITDSLIQIISGLQNNEQVAVNAQFMVDSESFIQTDGN